MRITIDKDSSERQVLQESYEAKLPTYSVKAVNENEKFIYAKGLKSINEAIDATYDLAFDKTFDDCKYEIYASVNGESNVIWSSEKGVLISESTVVTEADGKNKGEGKGKAGAGEGDKGFFAKLGDKAKSILGGLKKGIDVVSAMTKQFSKDMLTKWRNAGYFTKKGYITGLGYKVMTGQAKNTIPVDTEDKSQSIENVWKAAQSNVVNALKKQGMTVNGQVTAIVKNDKDPVLLAADVTTKDGEQQSLTLDQDGNTVDGDGNAVDPTQGGNSNGGNGGNGGGNNGGGNSANTKQITPDQAQKNPKAALGNLATRVANLEKEVGIAAESIVKWNFNDEQLVDKPSMERLAISTFFKKLNESNVGSIVFVEQNGNKKTYDVKDGSKSYSDFKKDFRESTGSVKKGSSFKLTIESTNDDMKGWDGYNYSDFGSSEWMCRVDESTYKRVVTFKATVGENVKKKVTTESSSKPKFKEGDIVQDKNDPSYKYEILEFQGNGLSDKEDGNIYLVKNFQTNNNQTIHEDALVQSENINESTSKFKVGDKVEVTGKECASKGWIGEVKSIDKKAKNWGIKVQFPSGKYSNDSGEYSEDELEIANESIVNESLELDDIKEIDAADQMKSLMDSMKKFDFSLSPQEQTVVDDNLVDQTPVGQEEVIKEADGDEDAGGDDAGGDADPFADDAGGGDEGGDADPFADDAGGDGTGGDGTGGDVGTEGGDDAGGDADPFADAGDGGDAGTEGGDGTEGGADTTPGDTGTDGGADDGASGEPAPDSAVNTDAQGNPKSQYNINVTRPFNSDDNFSLNEEEQKEFFGKIDQLVKIPDMDNYALYLYQITPENVNLDDVHYITSLYELSVKLGLLEDIYADSNLLDKYSSYKYSVLKDGEENTDADSLDLAAEGSQGNPRWQLMESTEKKDDNKKVDGKETNTGNSPVQKDNKEKNEQSKEMSTDDEEKRRGAKDTKLNKDKNGVDKPVIIDTTKDDWDEKNEKDARFNSTEQGEFHGLGWVVTFKAMQFGSPRYMSMYIKKNGSEKAETQCKNYLEKLSYTEIEIVNLEEIDPYEYVYRQNCSGMKSVEELQTAKFANKAYNESKKKLALESLPSDIKRDVQRVIGALNAEIRNTKQFNFIKECGEEKPQIDKKRFMECYSTAKVDETVSETTYKFILQKNDSIESKMFFSNLKEKLFKYLGTFATKYGMECGCEATPDTVTISFMRSNLSPMGYDLNTMVDTKEIKG